MSSNMANNALVKLGDAGVPGVSLNKDPEKCVVEELRRWLDCHVVKTTSK